MVEYDKDSLLKSLTEDDQIREENPKQTWKSHFIIPYQNLIRFVILLTTVIVVVTLVLSFTFILIKDVLLFKSNLSVNEHGVFIPNKSCGREYCLYLFNTSDLWANTGIYLDKGDRFKMSVSGAFHSSAGHLYNDAEKNNPKPDVNWIGGRRRCDYSDPQKKDDNTIKTIQQKEKMPYCTDPSAYIGAILYRITPEFQPWKPGDKDSVWEPIIGEKYHKVESSGVLTMASNDIYFQDTIQLKKYIDNFPFRFDSIKLNYSNILKSDGGKENYKRMFYDDNLGQILVCIEIQHPLPGSYFNPLSAFRDLETQTELKSENINKKWLFFLSFIPSFIGFMFHIFVIFIVYILATIIIVYFIFLLGYWGYKGINIAYLAIEKAWNVMKSKKQNKE